MNENHAHHGHEVDHSSSRLGVAAFSNIAFAVVQVLVGLAIG